MCHDVVALCVGRPDGIGTVTSLEREMFDEVKQRLHILLENEITHFR